MDPAGNDVAVHAEGEAAEEGHGDSHAESEVQNCHFHAGVEYVFPTCPQLVGIFGDVQSLT